MKRTDELVITEKLIQYAICDTNTELQNKGTIFRLKMETFGVIKFIPTVSGMIKSFDIELNTVGQSLVIMCFSRYGLLPIFYKGSMGVEVDND